MRGQVTMIDVLLLAMFISIVLIGSAFFAGSEQQRAQAAREEAGYAQAQLITALQYRDPIWDSSKTWDDNMTSAMVLNYMFCRYEVPQSAANCTPQGDVPTILQTVLNRTTRSGYNYIFYAADSYGRNFTICNRQVSVCSKNLPAIAYTAHDVVCPSSYVNPVNNSVKYFLGIWPGWMELPLVC